MCVVAHVGTRAHPDFHGHRALGDVEDAEVTPGFAGEHNLIRELVHVWLDAGAGFQVADEDALRTRRDHRMLEAHREDRHAQLVHDVNVLTVLAEDTMTDDRLGHLFGQGVPGAEVLPLAVEAHHLDLFLMLDDGIVEADFAELGVLVEEGLIVAGVEEGAGTVQHVAKLIGEDATVPEGPLLQVLAGGRLIRFFLEGADGRHRDFRLRDDVAVLLGWIGRLDAHQDEIRLASIRLLGERLQRTEIVIVHVRVHRADHDGFVLRNVTLFVQVGTREGDRREGVSSRRFDGDVHVGAEQVQDGRHLGAGGRDGDTRLRVHGADLAVDALDHRFIASVRAFEELDKLLGTDIVGKWPEALAGATG